MTSQSESNENQGQEDLLSILIEKELEEDPEIQKFEFADFENTRFLCNGGFGHIYTADCKSLSSAVALKTIRPNDDEYNDAIITSFFREVSR